MREIGNIYGCVVTIDDTLKDMGVQETTSINDIIITIQDSKTYYDIINNCKSDGIVNIVTWHENKEYHGMQYSIKLIRSYTINYNSTWNHVLQRRSGGDITITQNETLLDYYTQKSKPKTQNKTRNTKPETQNPKTA